MHFTSSERWLSSITDIAMFITLISLRSVPTLAENLQYDIVIICGSVAYLSTSEVRVLDTGVSITRASTVQNGRRFLLYAKLHRPNVIMSTSDKDDILLPIVSTI